MDAKVAPVIGCPGNGASTDELHNNLSLVRLQTYLTSIAKQTGVTAFITIAGRLGMERNNVAYRVMQLPQGTVERGDFYSEHRPA